MSNKPKQRIKLEDGHYLTYHSKSNTFFCNEHGEVCKTYIGHNQDHKKYMIHTLPKAILQEKAGERYILVKCTETRPKYTISKQWHSIYDHVMYKGC